MHAFESPLASPPSPPPVGYPATAPLATPSASLSTSAAPSDPHTAWVVTVAGSLATPHSRAASPVPGFDPQPAPASTSSSVAEPPDPTLSTSTSTGVERPTPVPTDVAFLHPQAERSTMDLGHHSTAEDEPPQPPGLAPPSLPPLRLPLGSPLPDVTLSAVQASPSDQSSSVIQPDTHASRPCDSAPPSVPSAGPSGYNGFTKSASGSTSRSPRSAAFSVDGATEIERERTRERRPKRVLNGYVLGKTLGAGSMGKVKLATLTATGLKLAIKMVPRHTSVAAVYEQARRQAASSGEGAKTSDFVPPPPGALARAREKDAAKELRAVREGSLQLLLYHPYVCGVRELIVQPHYYYLVEEYVSGGQLLDYIIAHGRLRERVARRFARQLVSAFSYLHANNVVHRDLKIENILLSEAGHVKLVDFGLANLWSPHRPLRTFCGSLYFAAPELLCARPYVGPEVDVWSLGVVLFVLVAGRVPFDDPSVSALHRKIQQGRVQYPAHLSSDCRHALARMLTVDPQQRATLAELASHPFFTKGYDGPPDSHLPRRMPLRPEELDHNVIKHMQGFAFGDPDEIERKLIQILTSDAYLAALAAWDNRHGHAMGPDSLSASPRAPPLPPPLRSRRPASSDNATTGGDELPPADPASLDPTAGFHPMLSVYYLVKEKLERDELSGGNPAFAEAALKVPSALAAPSAPTPMAASSSRAPDYGSSMPTADDIPVSPSMSGFGSNALPHESAKGASNPSASPVPPTSHFGPAWGMPVPQRPAETMRRSRGQDMPSMASGLGDVGITTAPTLALRGVDHGSTDTLPSVAGAKVSFSSTRTTRSHPPLGVESPIPPPSPVQTRVPVFDSDYRDRSRPLGEMRGPPRSRDAGAQLDQMVSAPRSPHAGALSRSSFSSVRSGPMSRTPSATTGLGIVTGEEPGRNSLGSPPREQHSRGIRFGGWRGGALSSLTSWKADEHGSAPTLQPENPSSTVLTPPRRAASMHSKLTPVPCLSESTPRWTDPAPVLTDEEDITVRAAPPEAGPLASLKKLGQIMSRSISTPFNDPDPTATPGPGESLSGATERGDATEQVARPHEDTNSGNPSVVSDGAKPVFLKGLFSVQTTSSRAPEKVQALLAAALTRMGVHFHPISGGFECVHAPSLAPAGSVSSAGDDPRACAPVSTDEKQAENEAQDTGTLDLGWQASQDVASTEPAEPTPELDTLASPLSPVVGSSFRMPWRRRTHATGSSALGSTDSAGLGASSTEPSAAGAGAGTGVTASTLEEMAVRFELCVVRVPILGVSGVQFHRVAGNPWQYQLLAKRILEEAKI